MADPQIVPSRDEFDTAARQVSQTAPPGLSREEFYGLVDKAIQSNRNAPPPVDISQHLGALGGVNANVSDTPTNTGLLGPTNASGIIHGMVSPSPGTQLALDAMPMLIPGTRGDSFPTAFNPKEIGMRDAISGITQGNAKPTFGVPGSATVKNVFANLADRFGLTKPDTASSLSQDVNLPPATPTTGAAGDMWDQALAEARAARQPSNPAPTLRKAPGGLTDELKAALEAAGKPDQPQRSTGAPAVSQTPAGKPGVTQAQYDALQRPSGQLGPSMPPSGSPQAPAGNGYRAGQDFAKAQQDSTARLTDLLAKVNGSAGGNGSGATPEAVASSSALRSGSNLPGAMTPTERLTGELNSKLSDLRRQYGADRIAQLTNPTAPEVGVGQIVKNTGAPSAMPDIAQQKVLQNLQDPRSIKDVGKFRQAVDQLITEYKRNGAPANSPTARSVHDLMLKFGYIK